MNHLPTILLTGFTGILGKRYAYKLAENGYRVVCPIRAGSEKEAQERFLKIFHQLKDLLPQFDESLVNRIKPVPGDVRLKDLGLPSSLLSELTGPTVKGIWHLAALLDLTETKGQDVYQTNFVGTLNVLAFAKQQRIRELHYFSTFGSSGKIHEGIVREVPGIKPPAFRNTYERTKWEAERHVWQAQIRSEISATIYRPSIVVGDSVLGRYEQFNVFNHVFDVISRVRMKLCEKQGLDPQTANPKYEVRILGDRNATLNIVPIDYVIDTVMKIYSVPRSQGRVYHIVNPEPPSLALAEKIFKQNVPWDAVRWEMFDPQTGFQNPYEKFIAKQIEFLTPYLLGEAIYDHSNVQAILAFHGGMPVLKNEVFLDAIAKRGKKHGWQEVKEEEIRVSTVVREQLDQSFVWPEGSGPVVDFSPPPPVANHAPTVANYSVTERLLGKVYGVRERFFAKRSESRTEASKTNRDIVIVPFGMGMTRRGEAEQHCYQYLESLTDQVFVRMNQIVGFDLRAYGRQEIPDHERYGDLHDSCCLAVADDLVHLVRLFRDVQKMGGTDFVSRLQILPHSAGTYLAGWLSGILSFEDAAQLVNQCAHFLSENERVVSLEEVERWFFNQRVKLSEAERELLKQIRAKLDPQLTMNRGALANQLHGRLELVFSLNAHVLKKLVEDIKENRINVTQIFTLSPNSGVFAGNELEMTRFRSLFVGKRKIELRRVPLEVCGTPHFNRFREAARHSTDLLRLYEKQGRLRDPSVPLISYNGQVVRSREDYIRAVAGIADQTCYFDRMIERALEEGGRNFILIQSGLSNAAGDLFEGIIRNKANSKGFPSVRIYAPAVRSTEPHPVCKHLKQKEEKVVSNAFGQSLTETVRWYERELSALSEVMKQNVNKPQEPAATLV